MQGSGRGGCGETVYCVEAGEECVPSDTTQPPQPLHRLQQPLLCLQQPHPAHKDKCCRPALLPSNRAQQYVALLSSVQIHLDIYTVQIYLDIYTSAFLRRKHASCRKMAFLTSDSLQETYLHHFCLCKHLLLYFCPSTENSKTSWMDDRISRYRQLKQLKLDTHLIVFHRGKYCVDWL